jgi:spermidine synthase
MLIESATEGDAVLELYAKDAVFMIRANGLELMNGFCHDSEVALGQLAAEMAPPAPRILLGGLGLGYTVAALAKVLGSAGTIIVSEFSAAVIDWFHRHVRQSVLPEIPGNLSIVHADIAELLTGENQYDLIVLDVDNGPEPLVTAGNGGLYVIEGLRSLHRSLSPGGSVLLWSGFESADFAMCAEQVGFRVRCEPFKRTRPELSHYIYVLAKR